MAWMRSVKKVPDKYDPAFFKLLIERIRTAVNHMEQSNFPQGISGLWLNDKTVTPKKLVSTMWYIPIIAQASGTYITSTTAVSIGGFVHWSAIWGSNVKLALQITCTSSSSNATATFTLEGAENTTLTTITTSAGTWEFKQSAEFAAPLASQTLVLKAKTSNASYGAGILNATLVVMPNN